MLVLNTNNEWAKVIWRASNEAYKSYPDFSQILIMPSYRADKQGQTSWTISIYWVPVHSYTATIFEGEFNSGTIWSAANIWDIWWILSNDVTTGTATYYHRIAADFKLKWWEVVWKEIRWKYYVYYWVNSAATYMTWDIVTSIKVYLIHQDWTMTLVNSDSHDRWDKQMGYYASGNWWTNWYEFSLSASWTTAQAWDVIMVEIVWDRTTAWTASSVYTTYLWFWCLWWTWVNDSQAYPIQISIE